MFLFSSEGKYLASYLNYFLLKKSCEIQKADTPGGVWGVGSYLGNAQLFVPIAQPAGDSGGSAWWLVVVTISQL